MPKLDDSGVVINAILLTETSASNISTPNAGTQKEFIDISDHILKRKNSSGSAVSIEGLSNPMTAMGDIIVGGVSGVPTKLVKGSDTNVLTIISGSVAWASTASSINDYICVQDQKPQNTYGGTFTAGDWRTRDINTEVSDSGSHVSIASNQIILSGGTYVCQISAPAFLCGKHQARLQNITDASTTLIGTSNYAGSTDTVAYPPTSRAMVVGKFTITGSKIFEVQHYCTSSEATDGFGVMAGITTEVYTIAEFWKTA